MKTIHDHKNFLTIVLYMIPAMVLILVFFAAISIERFRYIVLFDSDINWLIKTGEIICHQGLPAVDIFSYTHGGKEWILYQWLFEVIIYKVYSFGYDQAVGTFAIFLFALTFTVLFILLKQYQVNTFYSILSISLGGWIASATWYARPAIFTYLFVCLFLLLLHISETKNVRYLWFIPVLFLLWANIHIGFTFGILLFIIFLAYKLFEVIINKDKKGLLFINKLAIVCIISIIATLITPYGIKLYAYMLDLMSSSYMNNNIKELTSPNFHKKQYFAALLSIFLVISLSFFQKRQVWFYLICLALTICMTLLFVRNVPFMGIFAALVIGLQLQSLQEYVLNNDFLDAFIKWPFEKMLKIQQYCINLLKEDTVYKKIPVSFIAVLLFIIGLVCIQNIENFKKNYEFSLKYPLKRPYRAGKVISKLSIPGNMYTQPAWGSYFIRTLFPKYKVFIDTRFDMYGDDFFAEAHEIRKSRGDSWQKVLSKFDVNWILISSNSFIAKRIDKGEVSNWFKIYSDSVASIYMRQTPENRLWYESSNLMSAQQTHKRELKKE